MSCFDILPEIADYDTLADAYEASMEYLDEEPGEPDTLIINIQNLLLWHCYEVTEDEVSDTVLRMAISAVLKRNGMIASDVTGYAKNIIDDLTQI